MNDDANYIEISFFLELVKERDDLREQIEVLEKICDQRKMLLNSLIKDMSTVLKIYKNET